MPSAADQILQPLKALQEDNPDISVDTMKEAMQSILKDLQYFPDEVREKIDALYPPPPVVEKVEEKDELETMTADEVMNLATKRFRPEIIVYLTTPKFKMIYSIWQVCSPPSNLISGVRHDVRQEGEERLRLV